jgi:hypothetical protein
MDRHSRCTPSYNPNMKKIQEHPAITAIHPFLSFPKVEEHFGYSKPSDRLELEDQRSIPALPLHVQEF